MEWMARHGDKRSRPAELIPGTLRVISVGLDYGRNDDDSAWDTISDGERAYVARYALGRDYHKLMRNRLQKLADRIAEEVGPCGPRVRSGGRRVGEACVSTLRTRWAPA